MNASSTVVPIGLKTRMDDRMRLALDAMPVAVTWTRLDDGGCEFMNHRFVDLFGYGERDFATVFELIETMFYDAEQAGQTIARMRRFVGCGTLQRIELPSEEVLARCKNGAVIATAFNGVVVPEANMSLGTFVDISAAKLREQMLRRLAEEDPLTGLLNRRSFDAAAAAAISDPAKTPFGALVVMDLDGFKSINDRLGHQAGDDVLQHFATSLRKSFRRGDLLSRWGGDEFAALLVSPISAIDTQAVLERLWRELAEPIWIGGEPVQVQASAGMAFFPTDAHNLVELYRLADEAMYTAKRERKTARGF
jgi:diguanylate cyclase (GGDEF)-like protein